MNSIDQVLKEQYRILKEIGSGAFGKVYMAEDVQDKNKRYAVKRIPKQKIYQNEYLKFALEKELEIMKCCACENSVLFIEYFETINNYNIIMELCDNDLDYILFRRPKGFSEDELRIILLQLKNVFEIMDQKNIIHRDLKLTNIMICYINKNETGEKKYIPSNFIVKLADFGFSKILEEDITCTHLGTPATMAPEVMMKKNYCKKADIWSLGIIMYQLLYKKLPFNAKNESELLKLILNSTGFIIPEGYTISPCFDNLLKNVLQKDIALRFSWKEFYEHDFFTKYNPNSLYYNINSEYESSKSKYGSEKNLKQVFVLIGDMELHKKPQSENFNNVIITLILQYQQFFFEIHKNYEVFLILFNE